MAPLLSNLDSQTYNVRYADVIAPQAGGQIALQYSGGVGGGAGIQVPGVDGRGNVVMFGFPFETITSASARAAVIDRVLGYFGVSAIVPPNADFNDDGLVDGADFLAWQRNFGVTAPPRTAGDANGDGAVNADDLTIWSAQFGEATAAVAISLPASDPMSLGTPSHAALDAAFAADAASSLGAAAIALRQATQVDDFDRPTSVVYRAPFAIVSRTARVAIFDATPLPRTAPATSNVDADSVPQCQSLKTPVARNLVSDLKRLADD
jgi:hypothetical protein